MLKGKIGIEIHCQLNTKFKLFSKSAQYLISSAAPNTLTVPYDLASPGTLPIFNKEVIDKAVQVGLALNCQINKNSRFDRKHYFYHDLPSGYQITQKFEPIAKNGKLQVNHLDGLNIPIEVGIQQIQLEQDTAKTSDGDSGSLFIDYNRSGCALLEIVSDPDFEDASQVSAFIRKIQQILKCLNVSNVSMEDGSMRVDVNVGRKESTIRSELKNMIGLRNIEKAIEIELNRHHKENIQKSETRGYDVMTGETYHLRYKESSMDYRYMPDPELGPILLSDELIQKIKKDMPPLPDQIKQRLLEQGLSLQQAQLLLDMQDGIQYYDETMKNLPLDQSKECANFLLNVLIEDQPDFSDLKVNPKQIASLLNGIQEKKILRHQSKIILNHFETNQNQILSDLLSQPEIQKQIGITNSSNDILFGHLNDILKMKPNALDDIKGTGKKQPKPQAITFFFGQLMKKTQMKTDPDVVFEVLKSFLVNQHGISQEVFQSWLLTQQKKKNNKS